VGADAGRCRAGRVGGHDLVLTGVRDLPAGPAGKAPTGVNRLLILGIAVALGGLFLVAYNRYRTGWTPWPERLGIDELGLELMTGCCAFVVFTTPSCRPCKAALKVVRAAVEEASAVTEIKTIDAMEHPELATRYEVRTIPTVFLITASGHVIRRWRDVPEPEDLRVALTAV